MSFIPAWTIKPPGIFSKKSSILSKMASLVPLGILFTLMLWFCDKPFSWITISNESPTIIIFLFLNCSFKTFYILQKTIQIFIFLCVANCGICLISDWIFHFWEVWFISFITYVCSSFFFVYINILSNLTFCLLIFLIKFT